jgi:hypothetical protein
MFRNSRLNVCRLRVRNIYKSQWPKFKAVRLQSRQNFVSCFLIETGKDCEIFMLAALARIILCQLSHHVTYMHETLYAFYAMPPPPPPPPPTPHLLVSYKQ